MKVPAKKDIRKKRKNKPERKTPVRSRPVRSKAILIKPSEGVSYAAVLKNLKSRVNPNELGAKIGGIRETRTKDLLVELKCKAKDSVKLDSAFRDAIGATGFVRHLVPTVEVEILDIDPTMEAEDMKKTV